MSDHQAIIEEAYVNVRELSAHTAAPQLKHAVDQTIAALNAGNLRVASKNNGQWHTHEWIKKAILLYFRSQHNNITSDGVSNYYDKIALKYSNYDSIQFEHEKTRIVPQTIVRYGAFIAPNCVLMPSYINIGAYIGNGTMIDTWATIGSCAQIGQNVHISGGVGIGGVLEPLQHNPTIIEDNCFIGARSEIVEGVIIEEGSVISMGVFIGQSTRIYHRATQEITYGRIPAGSVVVPGNLPSPDNKYSLYCAVIVKQVDAKTRNKIPLNELLRA